MGKICQGWDMCVYAMNCNGFFSTSENAKYIILNFVTQSS